MFSINSINLACVAAMFFVNLSCSDDPLPKYSSGLDNLPDPGQIQKELAEKTTKQAKKAKDTIAKSPTLPSNTATTAKSEEITGSDQDYDLIIQAMENLKSIEPAQDHEILGPRWVARYKDSSFLEDLEKLKILKNKRPYSAFTERIDSLVSQLRSQGATVRITSTIRDKKRGYLMWGAFSLCHSKTDQAVRKQSKVLNRLNKRWKHNIPIIWSHPDGSKATRRSACRMARAYGVVYSTKNGAKNSKHYVGEAVDLVAVKLPKTLILKAPDGKSTVFNLKTNDWKTRDLNRNNAIITWVEKHFGLKKLREDYPHWEDDWLYKK
jgi:hypothetical protein